MARQHPRGGRAAMCVALALLGAAPAARAAPAAVDSLRHVLVEARGEDRVRVLNELCAALRGDEEGMAFGRDALSLADSLDDPHGRALAHWNLALGRYAQGSYLEAVRHFEESAAGFQAIDDKAHLASTHMLRAGCLSRLGLYAEALDAHLRSIDIAEESGETKVRSDALRHLGAFYRDIGEIDAAVDCTSRALALLDQDKPDITVARTNLSLGALCFVAEDYERAGGYYARGLEIAEQLGAARDIADANFAMGSLLEKTKESQRAREKLELAKAQYEELHHRIGIVNCLYELSLVHHQLGNLDEARRLGMECYESARDKGDRWQLQAVLEDLPELLEEWGDPETAAELKAMREAVTDSISTGANGRELGILEARHRFERIRQEEERERRRFRHAAAAGVGFLLLVIAAGALHLRAVNRKSRVIAAQRDEIEALHRIQSSFFQNISHEFRTPLTLIKGPLGSLRGLVPKGEGRDDLDMIDRSVNRLLGLVRQLLDLAKLESGKMERNARPGDLVGFLRGVAASFESLADRTGTTFEVDLPDGPVLAEFNADHCEHILSNLLSNAFKFTPDGGRVALSVDLRRADGESLPAGAAATRASEFRITVEDDGVGIPPEELRRIFDRFYQVQRNLTRDHEGTGIGLSLAKELVDLHGGTIRLESEPGMGTRATVALPLVGVVLPREPAAAAPSVAAASPAAGAIDPELRVDDVVLLVEDSADMRRLVGRWLADDYTILEAEDGSAGFELAVEQVPDVVISDVMMPGLDGNELCRRLKADARTSHVPIILLTARASREHRLEGLETGADDYLTKPFDEEELRLKVRNLIANRARLRERMKDAGPLRLRELPVSSLDEAFLKRAVEVVEANLEESAFSAEELAQATGMSRAQFHRKIRALAGQSTTEFIRSIRLEHGARLLRKQAGTVAEVTYMVGFGSQSYFTKCFRERFGVTPGEYQRAVKSRS